MFEFLPSTSDHDTYFATSNSAAIGRTLAHATEARGRRRCQAHRVTGILRLSLGDANEGAEAVPGDEGIGSGEGATTPTSDMQSSASGATTGGAEGIGASAAGTGVEKEDSKEGPEVVKEKEEDDGEPIFLPIGNSKDVRLFRAKLLAGSDEKWQEQLRRNVNVGQLGGQDAWAHELSTPEKGCLIVAKSTMFSTTQTYFNQVGGVCSYQ